MPEVGQKLVDEGELSGTVVMPSNTGAAVELVAQWLSQGTVPSSITLGVRSYPNETEIAPRVRRTAQRRDGALRHDALKPRGPGAAALE